MQASNYSNKARPREAVQNFDTGPGRYYLCCSSKVVSKVDAHYPSILEVHHEVGQVAISNAQHVLAAGD